MFCSRARDPWPGLRKAQLTRPIYLTLVIGDSSPRLSWITQAQVSHRPRILSQALLIFILFPNLQHLSSSIRIDDAVQHKQETQTPSRFEWQLASPQDTLDRRSARSRTPRPEHLHAESFHRKSVQIVDLAIELPKSDFRQAIPYDLKSPGTNREILPATKPRTLESVVTSTDWYSRRHEKPMSMD